MTHLRRCKWNTDIAVNQGKERHLFAIKELFHHNLIPCVMHVIGKCPRQKSSRATPPHQDLPLTLKAHDSLESSNPYHCCIYKGLQRHPPISMLLGYERGLDADIGSSDAHQQIQRPGREACRRWLCRLLVCCGLPRPLCRQQAHLLSRQLGRHVPRCIASPDLRP